MDLACGRGRHSMYLNRLGYQVTGVDLSPSSIAFAKAQLRQNILPEMDAQLNVVMKTVIYTRTFTLMIMITTITLQNV